MSLAILNLKRTTFNFKKSALVSSIGLAIMASGTSWANDCDYVVPSSQFLVDGNDLDGNANNGIDVVAKPGDTICLAEGERGPVRFKNLHGNESAQIVIRNESGLVTTTPYEYSIALDYSSYVRITSVNYSEEDPYNLKLGGTLGIGNLSHNVEVDHVEVYRARFAGILAKTDPNCDPASWQENFTMRGVNIHNNYIHHTETGEGMYVGYTGKSRTLTCDGETITVYPHLMENVRIENNLVEHTGADGIQLNSVLGNSVIAHNRIYRTGVSPFDPRWQNNGIQVGGNGVTVESNSIIRAGGNGMVLDGDDLTITGNLIMNAGELGIFARNLAMQDSSVSGGLPHVYKENHFINNASYALKLYATNTSAPNRVINNTVESDGSVDAAGRPMTFSYLNSLVLREELNNRHYIYPEVPTDTE